MTSRLLLILMALIWCTFAGASELSSDYEQDSTWSKLSISATQLTKKPKSDSKPTGKKNKESKTETEAVTPKHKRSRLDGMFDLLLPSGLRDNP